MEEGLKQSVCSQAACGATGVSSSAQSQGSPHPVAMLARLMDDRQSGLEPVACLPSLTGWPLSFLNQLRKQRCPWGKKLLLLDCLPLNNSLLHSGGSG